MEIRDVAEEDMERAVYIGRQAFALGSREGTSWLQDPDRPEQALIGIYEDGRLQARLVIQEYRVHLGPEVIVPMGGIAGVACLPAARGRGYASALLTHSLERMRAAGQVISTLSPFNWDYYRKYGWEWVGLNRTYKVPTRVIPASAETESVREATTEDRPSIEACYTQFARRYRGMHARSEKEWNAHLKDEDEHFTFSFVYEQDGATEGYLIYGGGKEEETWVSNFLALTPRAYRGLLGLLRRHEMQTKKFVWNAPENDPLTFHLCHNEVETKVEPMTQGRIVDVPAALQAWKPNAEARGRIHLAVEDTCAPWNTGVWRVEFADGCVEVRPTRAEPEVALDIQALSQVYFGSPTPAQLRAAERLTVWNAAGYDALCALCDGPPTWTYDHF